MRLSFFPAASVVLAVLGCLALRCQGQGEPTAHAAQYAPAGAGIGGVASMGVPLTLFDSRDQFALLQFKDTRLAIDQPGVGNNNFYSMMINCQRTEQVGPTGVGSHNCLTLNSTDYGPGVNFGNNSRNNAGWTVSGAFLLNKTSYTRGITQALTINHAANKIGDSAGIYIYHFLQGRVYGLVR